MSSTRRAKLAEAPGGAIVKVGERWGVVSTSSSEPTRGNRRVVDFWEGGRELVPSFLTVDVIKKKAA